MPEFGQQIALRLYDARQILVAGALLSLLLSLAGQVASWQAIAWLFAIFAVASLPIGSGAARKRQRLLRNNGRERLESVVFATCEALDDPGLDIRWKAEAFTAYLEPLNCAAQSNSDATSGLSRWSFRQAISSTLVSSNPIIGTAVTR